MGDGSARTDLRRAISGSSKRCDIEAKVLVEDVTWTSLLLRQACKPLGCLGRRLCLALLRSVFSGFEHEHFSGLGRHHGARQLQLQFLLPLLLLGHLWQKAGRVRFEKWRDAVGNRMQGLEVGVSRFVVVQCTAWPMATRHRMLFMGAMLPDSSCFRRARVAQCLRTVG